MRKPPKKKRPGDKPGHEEPIDAPNVGTGATGVNGDPGPVSAFVNGDSGLEDGYYLASRNEDAELLRKHHPRAYQLGGCIAERTRWNEEAFNPYNLKLGEACVGDHLNHGLSLQEYRTAKIVLEKGGFATFRPTSRGTIARLLDLRLFAIRRSEGGNKPVNKRKTNEATIEATTNQEPRAKKRERVVAGVRGAHTSSSMIEFEIPTEQQLSDYAEQEDLDAEAVSQFWHDHQRDGWTIRGKRIRYWQLALKAFCDTYAASKEGHRR